MRRLALLRGINVGGKNKLKMADLKSVLKADGFSEFTSYIQSGNIILSRETPFNEVEVKSLIKKNFDIDCEVLLFSPEKFINCIASSPFPVNDESISKIYFTFLQEGVKTIEPLDSKGFGFDEFILGEGVIYIQYASKYSDSKLNNQSIEKLLGVKASTRNLKTCQKLIQLLQE